MVHLDDEAKGILRYLASNYKQSSGLPDIVEYLKDSGYDDVTRRSVTEDLDYLRDVGYVRSKTKGKGEDREEKFYLSRMPFGGRFKRRGLQGRGVLHDASSLVKRLTGGFFFLFGFGVIIYEGLNFTGAVISTNNQIGISSILGFALLLIGGFLFKKKK